MSARDIIDVSILLPDLRGGGAERVNINLANEFVARGLSVDMVLMRATGEMISKLDPRVRVVDLDAGRRVRHLFFPLVRYIRLQQPTSMLACMWPLTVVAVLARLFARKPLRLVLAEHTTWSVAKIAQKLRTRLVIKLTMRVLYSSVDALVAVSKGAALDLAKMANLPADTVHAIYNPIVDPGRAAPTNPVSPDGWVSGPHKRILAVGTLTDVKDYPTLIRAFAVLQESIDARLLILGQGTEQRELQLLADELGVAGDIFMPGFTLDPAGYFAHADLHVLSSVAEGLSVVIVEALEQGTPVVSTDCPSGPREILKDGQLGILVPIGDHQALAEAMKQSLISPTEPGALKARAMDFSIAAAADRYIDLLLPSSSKIHSKEASGVQTTSQGS